MLKLGITGMSPGNAHPYSWSAIINGYFDAEEICRIGYPAVAQYLEANKNTLGIPDAKITQVWAQDEEIARSIAHTTQIDNVCRNIEDMIGQVDAVFLSRDDAENHVAMAKPFIDAGIPIFIDKPIALTHEDLEYFAAANADGKLIMSCSSMRYANECMVIKQESASMGEILLVTAVGKKDWNKYGVHLLEAVSAILDDPAPVTVRHIGESGKDIVYVTFENGVQAVFHLFMDISPTFQVSVFGRNGWRMADIKNSYSMFRDNIIEFIRSVRDGKSRLPFKTTEQIIRVIIGANESLKHDGKKMNLI